MGATLKPLTPTQRIDVDLGRALDSRRAAQAQIAEHEARILELCRAVLALDEVVDELLLARLGAGGLLGGEVVP